MSEVKIGDVVVVGLINHMENIHGCIGIITAADGHNTFPYVINIGADDMDMNTESLIAVREGEFEVIDHIESNDELLEQTAELMKDYYVPEYNVGDKVKYIGTGLWENVTYESDNTWKNQTSGVIVCIYPSSEYVVQFEDGTFYSVCASDLKLDDSNNLKSYSIETIMTWRNAASNRVTKADEDLQYILKCMEEFNTKMNRIEKKRASDAIWISKLNNILYKRVIKDRK